MKKIISQNQWDLISDVDKLKFWNSIISKEDFDIIGEKNWLISKPDIGSLIDFLGEKIYRIDPPWGDTPEFQEWAVTMENKFGGFWDGDELCDALWDAVKDQLNPNYF